jgi:hypothetical protein
MSLHLCCERYILCNVITKETYDQWYGTYDGTIQNLKRTIIFIKKTGRFNNHPVQWNRRESNPGPNKQLKSFLHVYFLNRFSTLS